MAVLLGLSGMITAAVFALAGAGLVWLGMVQQRRWARFGGIALQGLAVRFWMVTVNAVTRDNAEAFVAIANPAFMGGLMIALAGFATACLYRRHARGSVGALWAYWWALLWWLGIAGREILEYGQAHYCLHDYSWPYELHALALLFGLTGWWVAERQRLDATRALRATSLGCMALAMLLLVLERYEGEHIYPFAPDDAVLWGLLALLGQRSLRCLREAAGNLARAAQRLWLLVWLLLLLLEAAHVFR